MAGTKIKPIKSTLSKALDYIQNPDKTDGKTGCLLSFRVKAVREKAMRNIKRKRREQVGKAS